MELNVSRFDLPAALDNAITLVRERATLHGIALETHIDERLGEYGGDERKLKQILINLLSNAIKFTPEGGKVAVWATRESDAVQISVTDTGIGIAEKDLDRIFEEFRQVGTDVERKHEGTGLGLALTRAFVEMHGGTISVESELEEGTRFTVILPIEVPGASLPANDQESGQSTRVS